MINVIKRLKNIGLLSLVFLLVIGFFTPINAQQPKIEIVDSGVNATGYAYTQNSLGYSVQWSAGKPFPYLKANGDMAFCIQPEYVLNQVTGYTQSSFNHEQNETFTRIIYHGYDSNPSAENYVLTQLVLWEYMATLRDDFNYGGFQNMGVANYETKKAALWAKVDNHEKIASFHNTTHTIDVGKTITLTDTNNVLINSAIVNNENLNITIKNNQLLITGLPNSSQNHTIRLKKYADIDASTSTSPLLFSHPTSQNVITRGNPNPMNYHVNIEVNHEGTLQIAKVNAQGKPIPQTTFIISNNTNMTNPLGPYTTNQQGVVNVSNLKHGTYYIQELSVPSPYVLDSRINTVQIKAGELTTFTQTNQLSTGVIKILKLHEERTLQGATFEIRNTQDQIVETITTNQSGLAQSKQLPLGKYFIQETAAPQGYVLDSTIHEVELVYKDQHTSIVTTSLEVENKKVFGEITIKKTDVDTKEPLMSSTFEIRNTQDQIVETITTNQSGLAQSKHLPLGKYIIQETAAPQGYVLDSTIHEVELVYKDQHTSIVTTSLEVENQMIYGEILINKLDSVTSQPIANAIFDIIDSQTEETVDTITTNEEGKAHTKSLPYGKYLIKEVEAPAEYYLNHSEHFVEIRNHNQTVPLEILNKPILIDVQIHKTDITSDTALEGVIFDVYKEDTLVTSITTDELGYGQTETPLPIGDYTLVERLIPGYLPIDPIPFTIDRTVHEPIVLEIDNQQTEVVIHKLDINGKPLPGARLAIFDENNEQVTEWISSDSKQIINGLHLEQVYTLVEIEAPEGYLVNKPINFTVSEGEVVMVNHEIPLIKTSARFLPRQTDSPQTLVIEDVVSLSKLRENHTYTIQGILMDKETQQPYLINNEPVTIEQEFKSTHRNHGETMVYPLDTSSIYPGDIVVFVTLFHEGREISNHHDINDNNQTVSLRKLTVHKVDHKTRAGLPHAIFEVYQDDLLIEVIETDEQGYATLVLEDNQFKLKEVSAPDSYVLDETVHNIRLDSDVELEISNKKIEFPELPSTGLPKTGETSGAYLVLGGSMILIGLGLYLRNKKRGR